MFTKYFAPVLALLLSTGISAPASADSLGEAEFLNSCANCHGADGKGGGTIVAYLKTSLPDFSQLSKRNGGVFPYGYTIWMIDRRKVIPVHGGDMPVWGDRFTADAINSLGGSATPEIRELLARGRILSLVYYLESIQE